MNGHAITRFGTWLSLFALISVLTIGIPRHVCGQESKNLIQVLGEDGKPTALLEKVVVVSNRASISANPNDSGEPIEPWAIFFRVKNEDGSKSAVNGKLRVGTSTGKPIGWIQEKDLRTWNTRFILDPIEPQGDRAFEVRLDGAVAKQNATPEGKRRYALITDSASEDRGDDTQYPVVVYSGNVQGLNEGGTLSQQRNDLEDVKLEIMFVIESSDFMFRKTNIADGDDRGLMDFVKNSIRSLVEDIRRDDKIRMAVRLGFSEYKDDVPRAAFASRLTCDLTDDFDSFSRSLDEMTPSTLQDDYPDDVLSGLNEAVMGAKWTNNSVKHIILVGMASCQLCEKGQNPPESGNASSNFERFRSGLIPKGFNGTGQSISQLISKARPQGGSDSRARSTRMFHALHFGKDPFSGIPAEEIAQFKENIDAIRKICDEASPEVYEALISDEENGDLVSLVGRIEIETHQRNLALRQYKEISQNNGEADGIFSAVDPGDENVLKAVTQLSQKIKETFQVLDKVREGRGLGEMTGNEIAQPLYTLVGASAEKFKESTVFTGTASLRNDRGREIAFKKVMVSEDELRRLRSTLDSLHTTFKEMTRKADRQDVGSILDKMKTAIAATSAGQDIGANVKLKDLISDLPLRTAALDTTPQDLASMTSEAFTEWLDRLESAKFRIDDLLNASQEWLTLSESAVNDKFTFLRLSELP
jgi:hypothetical protein